MSRSPFPEAQKPPVEEQIPIPGYHRFEFRDPFGNRVEMIQAVHLQNGDAKPG